MNRLVPSSKVVRVDFKYTVLSVWRMDMTKAEEVVQEQLDHYNENNLQAFVSMYHEDIEIVNLEDNTTILKGKEALSEKYRERFEIQKVQARLINRMVIGDKVIDHEAVSGIKPNELVYAVATYKVENNLIRKVWFLF